MLSGRDEKPKKKEINCACCRYFYRTEGKDHGLCSKNAAWYHISSVCINFKEIDENDRRCV